MAPYRYLNTTKLIANIFLCPLFLKGSTKVFKMRPGQRKSNVHFTVNTLLAEPTTQTFTANIHGDGAFFLLPDPVTCFRSASYTQKQTIHLSSQASAIILDWFTSGRRALDEHWAFTRYASHNELFVEGQRVARDVMLLQNEVEDNPSPNKRTLADRLAPYSCYATLLLHGPLVQEVIDDFSRRFASLSIFRRTRPDEIIWSFSSTTGSGAIVRVAGKDTEGVKNWLKASLKRLESVVGVDVFRRTFV
jgi:urease accessory protein